MQLILSFVYFESNTAPFPVICVACPNIRGTNNKKQMSVLTIKQLNN